MHSSHMLENLQLQECIGSGSFGEVYKALNLRTKQLLAVKVIDLEDAEGDLEEVRRETRILAQLRNPYIVTYYSSLVFETTLWIIMEYLEGGSLRDLLDCRRQPFKESIIARFIQNILQGLKYLHMEKRIHRDIKAANVLLSKSGVAKLVDFGVSQQLSKTMQRRNTFVGTPYWMAPEVIAASYYDEKADIWSLGITILELACGKPPWFQVHPMKALFLISEEDPPILKGNFSSDLKDFVSHCLHKEPEERWDAIRLLKHPFLKAAADYNEISELLQGIKKPGKPVRKSVRSGKSFLKEKVMMKKIETFHWTFGRVLKVQKNDNLVSCTVRLSTGSQREFQLYSKEKEESSSVLKNQEGSLCKIIRNGMALDSLQFDNGTVLRIVSSKLDTPPNNTVIRYRSADTSGTETVIRKSPTNSATNSNATERRNPQKSPRKNLLSLFGHQRSLSDPVTSTGTVITSTKDSQVDRNPSESPHSEDFKYLTRHPFLPSWSVEKEELSNKAQEHEYTKTVVDLPQESSTVKKNSNLGISKNSRQCDTDDTITLTSETNHNWEEQTTLSTMKKATIENNHTKDIVIYRQNNDTDTVVYRKDSIQPFKQGHVKVFSSENFSCFDDTMSMDRMWVRKGFSDPYIEFASRDYSQTVSETVLPKRVKSLVVDDDDGDESSYAIESKADPPVTAVETMQQDVGDLEDPTRENPSNGEHSQPNSTLFSLSSTLQDAHPILVKIIVPAIRQLEADASTLDDNDMQEIKLLSDLASTMFQLDEIRPGVLFILFRQIFKEFASCEDEGLRSLFYSFLERKHFPM
ncbi:serine/threonine protein kinase isoform 1 [Galdieria sulphuraria]|uniref:non-specific serine/threonine protein kinase n=1 Tax=Galdieria sulphuraria TaxID=130081 RepID=M2XS31_GALSU|nr:serine/threonine protein kinase isoform 2 [Galdieria sulphuraria]XP_005702989.1 serine/threonine protein kinase isoform 1 [Galdieria sulphuraria]EME26468.1 serine/threonine protein kinase isoform 2 [Galdieria sulphuraria]EME26469.1 serine/threonine protein kinase isoform 1 [Galdieria sulphuraria]|eukprot:XP_005702988.1 serine/threonine protein kinase isoform 2 [Galdieria sulphuraria]